MKLQTHEVDFSWIDLEAGDDDSGEPSSKEVTFLLLCAFGKIVHSLREEGDGGPQYDRSTTVLLFTQTTSERIHLVRKKVVPKAGVEPA